MADGYVLDRALKELVQNCVRQYANSFQPRPKAERRQVRGGPGDGNNLGVTFGLVAIEAAANGASTGKYIPLDKDMFPLDKTGQILIIDPQAPGYSQTAYEEAQLEFKSAHVHAPCPQKARIWVTTISKARPGSLTGNVTWGQLVDVVDYLYTLTGHAPETSLVIPTGATTAAQIKWQGGAC